MDFEYTVRLNPDDNEDDSVEADQCTGRSNPDCKAKVKIRAGGTDRATCSGKVCKYMRQNLIMVLILIGIVLGFGLGLAIRRYNPSDDTIMWIGIPGDLYMRLLTMTIMPLIVCSVMTGASTLDPKTSGKIGGALMVLIFITHIIVCCLAAGLIVAIKPGAESRTATTRQMAKAVKTHDVFADLLRNLMPDNMVGATFQQTITKYVTYENTLDKISNLAVTWQDNGTFPYNVSSNTAGASSYNGSSTYLKGREAMNINTHAGKQFYTRVVSHSNGINVLGLITISAVFGIAAGKVKKGVPVFLSFIENVLHLVLIVVRWFFWLTPIGVVSLIAKSVCQVDSILETFSDLGMFVITVLIVIVIHWVIVLPALYVIFVRKNPLKFFWAHMPAVSAAFAGPSTTIALPVMFHICENKFMIDKRITRIGMPIVITLNANGSALFIVAASLFLSDCSGVEPTANNVIVTLLLAMISTLAIPSVPSASIICVIIVLTAIQVPQENVAILFAIEWFLDRVRTGLNVACHMTVIACTDALCINSLRRADESEAIKS